MSVSWARVGGSGYLPIPNVDCLSYHFRGCHTVIRTDKKKKNEISYFTLHFISPVVHAGPVRSAILEVSNKLLLVTGGCWWAGAAVNNSPILRKTHSARLSASQQPCCPCRGMLPCYAMRCHAMLINRAAKQRASRPASHTDGTCEGG